MPQFIPDQSDPENDRYVFAYTITIKNVGTMPAQAGFAALDHHRRQQRGAGSARHRRRRQAAAAASRAKASSTPAARP
jgi:hypothetical protein